jgi:HK97 family phage major capsid protein
MKRVFIKPKHLPCVTSRRMGLHADHRHNIAYKSDGTLTEEEAKEAEALQTQLKELRDNLATETDDKIKKQLQREIADLLTKLPTAAKVKELEQQLIQMKKDSDANQKALDDLIAKGNTAQVPNSPMTPSGYLEKMLTEKETILKQYKDGNGKGFSVTFDRKVVGNMGSSANLTGAYFVPPTLVPGVILQPYEEVHLRNILPVGQTNSNVIRYVRDMGGEGGPGMVAESGTKPQMDRDLQIFDANVRKIATYMRVPEEMMDDIPYLSSFLTQVGTEEVMLLEDEQILYGDGTGQNLSGLSINSTAFSSAGFDNITAPNRFDVLRAGRTQARLLRRRPTVALVNPGDYFLMESTKDTTNNYLFLGGGNGINPGRNVAGLTILDHTSVEPDDFFILDPRAAAIFDRTGLTVRFYDQDQDNAIKNLITIVIEKRLALPIYYTTGIIYGNFTDAIADLDDAS